MSERMLSVYVNDDSDLDFGQKLYVISIRKKNGSVIFSEICPLCGDEGKIEIKGYTFQCPMCQGYGAHSLATRIVLYCYEVREYIIHSFDVLGSTYKNAYTGEGMLNDRNLPSVQWYGFTRWGTGYRDVESKKFDPYYIGKANPENLRISEDCSGDAFYTKAEAERFCKRLHERQKELLEKFNADHGTNHEYPFEF